MMIKNENEDWAEFDSMESIYDDLAVRVEVYHEDYFVLQEILENTKDLWPHTETHITSDDTLNDGPFEVHSYFGIEDAAYAYIEFVTSFDYDPIFFTIRYKKWDYMAEDVYNSLQERNHRLATVYGPHLDGIVCDTPEATTALIEFNFKLYWKQHGPTTAQRRNTERLMSKELPKSYCWHWKKKKDV